MEFFLIVAIDGINSDESNRTIKKQVTRRTNSASSGSESKGSPPILVGDASLSGIAILARKHPEMTFTSLAHRLDLTMLHEAFRRVKESSAAGVDKVTALSYAVDLDQNLYNLHQRLCRGQYAATPVKRIWIEKENGKQRPIGIPAFEDKVAQKAVEMILSAIYEPNFYNFSHGFRARHSQHMAIKELREESIRTNTNWIVSADITGLFDNIDHDYLREFLKLRVNDGGIIRLIGKWLKAGVMEEGRLYRSDTGTPQGGVISPVLSNIFLHYVLDDWYVREVQPRMKGRSFLIRFADDFITGFELESDARRALEAMRKRFDRYGLELHPDKTKLLRFARPGKKKAQVEKSGTFDFLGFTFYLGMSRRGYWVIMKKTASKRLHRFKKGVWEWCKKNRHKYLKEQYAILCSKLRGYYQYFGVISNFKAIANAHYSTLRAWRYWLCKRSHKGNVKYEDLSAQYPLPKPRIVHNI